MQQKTDISQETEDVFFFFLLNDLHTDEKRQMDGSPRLIRVWLI